MLSNLTWKIAIEPNRSILSIKHPFTPILHYPILFCPHSLQLPLDFSAHLQIRTKTNCSCEQKKHRRWMQAADWKKSIWTRLFNLSHEILLLLQDSERLWITVLKASLSWICILTYSSCWPQKCCNFITFPFIWVINAWKMLKFKLLNFLWIQNYRYSHVY